MKNWFQKFAENYLADLNYLDIAHPGAKHYFSDKPLQNMFLWVIMDENLNGNFIFKKKDISDKNDSHLKLFGEEASLFSPASHKLISQGRALEMDDGTIVSAVINRMYSPLSSYLYHRGELNRRTQFYKNKIDKILYSEFENPKIYWF